MADAGIRIVLMGEDAVGFLDMTGAEGGRSG